MGNSCSSCRSTSRPIRASEVTEIGTPESLTMGKYDEFFQLRSGDELPLQRLSQAAFRRAMPMVPRAEAECHIELVLPGQVSADDLSLRKPSTPSQIRARRERELVRVSRRLMHQQVPVSQRKWSGA